MAYSDSGKRLALFAIVVLLGCAGMHSDSGEAARRYVGEPKGALTLSLGLTSFMVLARRQRRRDAGDVIDIRPHLQTNSPQDASGSAAGEAFERRLAA
ncbi:MAG: hypothetical protein ACUVSM_04845 [Armatimonadota bacterium]|jgi:hypothetical protein